MGLETVHTMKYVRLMCNFQYCTVHVFLYVQSELGTRQCRSFTTLTTRQHNIAAGNRKYIKIFRSQCLYGVATPNVAILQ